jgi:hypothetical protein
MDSIASGSSTCFVKGWNAAAVSPVVGAVSATYSASLTAMDEP